MSKSPEVARGLAALFLLAFLLAPAHGAIPRSDYDFDGDVGGRDLAVFATYYTGGETKADLDSDGHVNAEDVAAFAACLGFVESFAHTYDVGPGQPYADPSEVPWESLAPGSLIRIHHRKQPYANKWVLAVSGTCHDPIVVRGIPENDARPVITGENATTRLALDYWNEDRSVIKVGGSSSPSAFPTYVIIENLAVRSARPPYTFADDRGNVKTYRTNAASIHVEEGEHIVIRNCILQDSGNGFFSGAQSADLLLEGNYIYGNGIENSIYHHNNYTESLGITFQHNRFGPLRPGCKGNNLKDRSAGTVVRYNWIEAGNRTLDLVESDHSTLRNHPSYGETFVYGNVLIKHDVVENSQVLHYGGDGGDEGIYRKGTLWFFNNTVVSHRSGNTTLMRLSSKDEHSECFNNIVYAVAAPGRLAILDETGTMNLYHNWLSAGWVWAHGGLAGDVNLWENVEGDEPGFADMAGRDYSLLDVSPCVDEGIDLPPELLPAHELLYQYTRHQRYTERPHDDHLDLGAFEG